MGCVSPQAEPAFKKVSKTFYRRYSHEPCYRTSYHPRTENVRSGPLRPSCKLGFCLKISVHVQDGPRGLQTISSADDRKAEGFAVALKDTDELIGKIHIDEDHLRYDVNSVDLAYWLGEEYTRKGYMTEALSAFIDYLFEERKYDAITAQALAPNTASRALLSKLGFVQEGYLRRAIKDNGVIYDNVLFSLLKEDKIK